MITAGSVVSKKVCIVIISGKLKAGQVTPSRHVSQKQKLGPHMRPIIALRKQHGSTSFILNCLFLALISGLGMCNTQSSDRMQDAISYEPIGNWKLATMPKESRQIKMLIQ